VNIKVGKTYNYDSNDNLLWVGKTLLKSAITVTTGSQKLNAGPGNVLQMVYYHTGELALEQEEQQFNLTMISKTLGASIVTGASVWQEENVVLTANAGVVTGTPIATSSGTIYGWAELSDGSTERFTFSGSNLTLVGQATGTVCVRYYATNSSARQLTVNANIIPSVVRTVVEAQMFTGDPNNVSTSTLVGKVLVEVPRLQLDGSATLTLSTTGASSTPINGTALASAVAGCSTSGVYATITEVVNSANWYDGISMLAIADDTIAMSPTITSYTIPVWAVPTNGDAAFIAPVADLTFLSGTPATATVGAHTGILTRVTSGSSIITCSISNKSTVNTTATVTSS
jgi:hypothetical protein